MPYSFVTAEGELALAAKSDDAHARLIMVVAPVLLAVAVVLVVIAAYLRWRSRSQAASITPVDMEMLYRTCSVFPSHARCLSSS
jgi:hypothetical protein